MEDPGLSSIQRQWADTITIASHAPIRLLFETWQANKGRSIVDLNGYLVHGFAGQQEVQSKKSFAL
jgi:hypothetical protein